MGEVQRVSCSSRWKLNMFSLIACLVTHILSLFFAKPKRLVSVDGCVLFKSGYAMCLCCFHSLDVFICFQLADMLIVCSLDSGYLVDVPSLVVFLCVVSFAVLGFRVFRFGGFKVWRFWGWMSWSVVSPLGGALSRKVWFASVNVWLYTFPCPLSAPWHLFRMVWFSLVPPHPTLLCLGSVSHGRSGRGGQISLSPNRSVDEIGVNSILVLLLYFSLPVK